MSSDTRLIKIKRRIRTNKKSEDDNEKYKIDLAETVGPDLLRNVLSSPKTLFLSLLAFRIINSLINQTQNVPDEFWQSVEVAHKWAFDIGYLTWEWLPEAAIRSPLYPLMFAVPFKILQLLGMDGRILLIKLPGLIQSVFASVSDYYLYLFAFRQAGQAVAQWTLFNQLINWFTFYSCTRTLTNNVEWGIVIITLYEYQRIVSNSKKILSRRFILLVVLCFILRPTGLVFMLPMCFHHLISLVYSKVGVVVNLCKTLSNALVVGTFTLSLSLLVDKHFYGQWTCSQWNFLYFNLFTDVSQNYGVHPWHWYISNAIPAMFLTQLPLLVLSLWSEWKESQSRNIVFLSLFVLYSYSCLGHKEFRFIFPLMPLGMYFLGRMFVRYSSRRYVMVMYLVLTQVPMILYMSLIHQRGSLDAVMAVGRYVEQHPSHISNTSVVFLMPCHSTPWSSHLHYNISARFLTCDPQITGSIRLVNMRSKSGASLNSLDEADLFYSDPKQWLHKEYLNVNSRPTFWVMFDHLQPLILPLLSEWNYHLCKRFFHAHFPTHSRHSGYIVVYCTHGFQF